MHHSFMFRECNLYNLISNEVTTTNPVSKLILGGWDMQRSPLWNYCCVSAYMLSWLHLRFLCPGMPSCSGRWGYDQSQCRWTLFWIISFVSIMIVLIVRTKLPYIWNDPHRPTHRLHSYLYEVSLWRFALLMQQKPPRWPFSHFSSLSSDISPSCNRSHRGGLRV